MFALRLATLTMAVLALPALARPAHAQAQQAFSALQAAGFEVRSVAPMTMEQTQRINPASTHEAVVVTLQKGPQVAVCLFVLQNWAYMAADTLNNATLCEVR